MDIKKFHKDLLVWDAHRDLHYELPYAERFLNGKFLEIDLHLDKLKKGGMDVQTYAFCYASALGPPAAIQAVADLEKTLQKFEENAADVVLVKTTAEALQAKQAGKLAAFFSFEGAEPIGEDLWLLRFFYRCGFRAMGFTWNYRNALADGGYEGRDGYGLSAFGREVVREMNRLGMVIDLAHLSPQSMRDVLNLSEHPVIHSHGGTYGVNPGHPRTLEDPMLEGIARSGGVFCATTVPAALTPQPEDAALQDFIKHIDHAVQVMGEDHVGLGADFDVYQSHVEKPLGSWTKDLEEVDQWMKVTLGLLDLGYSEERISKIMGENLLRVYRTVLGS